MRTRTVLPLLVTAGVLAPVAFAATPLTGEVQLNTSTAGDQDFPGLAAGGGQYVAAWRDSKLGIRARRVTAAGAPNGGEIAVAANPDATRPRVAAAPSGAFVVVWVEFDAMTGTDVWMRRFGADGSPGADAARVNVSADGQQGAPDVAVAPDGSFWVMWSDQAPADTKLMLRRYGANGAPLTGEKPGATTDDDGTIAAQSDGGVVLASDELAATDYDAVAQRFGPDGTPGTKIDLRGAEGGTDTLPLIARGPADSILAVWGSGDDAVWRRFSASLAPLGAVVPASASSTVIQYPGSIGAAGDGRVVVAWENYETSGSDAQLRRFGAADAPLTGDLTANTNSDGYKPFPQVAVQPNGDFAVAWGSEDANQDGDGNAVYARFYTAPASATPTPSPSPSPSPSPTPEPTVTPKFRDFVTFPANRRCVRKLRLKLKDVSKVTVRIKGKKVAKPRKTIRKLPKGRFTVKVTIVTKGGVTLKGKRAYRRCKPV